MFFEQAKKGNNNFLYYILTFIITFILGYSILGIIPLFSQLMIKSGKWAELSEATNTDEQKEIINDSLYLLQDVLNYDDILGSKNLSFLLLTSIFVVTAVCFWFCIRYVHNKKMLWIVTGFRQFRWNYFGIAFLIGAVLVFLNVFYIAISTPEQLVFQFQASKFFPLLLMAIVLIPIQAGWEEAFFRGWMMQGFGLAFKNRAIALLISTTFFASMHLANPEVNEHGVASMFPLYFVLSLSFGIMVLLSEGLELSMGFHIANNLFLSLLINTPESVLQTNAIFSTTDPQDISGQLFSFILSNVIVLGIFAWYFKWTNWKEKLFGSIS